jgi:predicted RNA-binding protein (virulence factor B family)
MSLHLGEFQELPIDRITSPGAFLSDGEMDVLLPTKYIPKGAKVGDLVNAFLYRDSEDRPIFTTLTPHLKVNEFGYLKVKQVTPVGAFLDWGIEKDLLVPFREMNGRLEVGQWVLVYLYLDEVSDRLVATSKVSRFYRNSEHTLEEGQAVQVMIANTSDLGVNVIIENKYTGLIYHSDIFHDVMEGDRMTGFVKTVRPDFKLDISLRKTGLESLEEGAQFILDELKANDGFLPLTDKSSPEEIQVELQMSKKNFKRSVGILYKQKLITLEKDGIRLLS